MIYNSKEACARLGIGLTKLNQICSERKIGFIQERAGCARKFTDKHIEAYLDRYSRAARRI